MPAGEVKREAAQRRAQRASPCFVLGLWSSFSSGRPARPSPAPTACTQCYIVVKVGRRLPIQPHTRPDTPQRLRTLALDPAGRQAASPPTQTKPPSLLLRLSNHNVWAGRTRLHGTLLPSYPAQLRFTGTRHESSPRAPHAARRPQMHCHPPARAAAGSPLRAPPPGAAAAAPGQHSGCPVRRARGACQGDEVGAAGSAGARKVRQGPHSSQPH